MPATPLPVAERFFQPEVTKCWFVPTIADPGLAYTLAERDAGTDLTGEIADVSGFNVTSGLIDTPDLASRFTSQIGGRTTTDASSITFYGDKSGDDVRTVLPRGTRGFIVWADGGDTAASPSDVYPVEVTSVGKLRSTGDQAYQLTINFGITREPLEDFPIPAAA